MYRCSATSPLSNAVLVRQDYSRWISLQQRSSLTTHDLLLVWISNRSPNGYDCFCILSGRKSLMLNVSKLCESANNDFKFQSFRPASFDTLEDEDAQCWGTGRVSCIGQHASPPCCKIGPVVWKQLLSIVHSSTRLCLWRERSSWMLKSTLEQSVTFDLIWFKT